MNRIKVLLLVTIIICQALPALAVSIPNLQITADTQAVWANGKLHHIGGIAGVNRTDAAGKIYFGDRQSHYSIYDPSTNTWTGAKWDGSGPKGIDNNGNGICEANEGLCPGASQSFAYDFDTDGTTEIFIHAGYPSLDGNFWVYDPDTNSWSKVGNMGSPDNFWGWAGDPEPHPANPQYFGVAALGGTTAYCYGGQLWGVSQDSFAKFDLTTNTWIVLPKGPVKTSNCIGAVINGKLYIAGGWQDKGSGTVNASTSIWAYNIATESWEGDDGFGNPAPVANLAVGVERAGVTVYNNKMYIAGGYNSSGMDVTTVQVFNPATLATTVLGNMPVGMSRNGCVINPATGILYVGEGRQGGIFTNSYRWWKTAVTSTPLTWTMLPDDPAYFPYQDWISGDESVRGQVTCEGVPIPNAVVGIKLEANAAADAQCYGVTDAEGNYGPILVPRGSLYVAAWVEGFLPTADTNITINEDDAAIVNLTLLQPAGKNLSLSAGGRTVAVWSDSIEAPDRTADKAADDNMITRWSNNQAAYLDDESWYIDLDTSGTTHSIGGVTIYWETARPQSYSIEYTLDDPQFPFADWTTVYQTASGGGYMIGPGIYVDAILFDLPIDVRGIRLHCTERKPGYNGYSAWEIKIHSATERDGLVFGYVRDAITGNPIYNAAIQVGGPGGNALITGATGFYLLTGDLGDQEIYADAFGYGGQVDTVSLTAGIPAVKNFELEAQTEPGIYNGDFETAGGTPSEIDGWELFIDDGGANPNMYTAGRDTTDNTTPDGEACAFIKTDMHNPTEPYWRYGWISPAAEHRIAVDPTKGYNFYLKGRMAEGWAAGFWSFIWRRADNSEISRVSYPGWYLVPADYNWLQFIDGDWGSGPKPMLRLAPPSDAAYIDIQLGITDWPNDEEEYIKFQWDDIVVDSFETPAITGQVLDPSGNGMPGAIVGLKTSPKATADALVYAVTDINGNYTLPIQLGTAYYIAAWKEGWTPTTDSSFIPTENGATAPTLQLVQLAGKNILPANAIVSADDYEGGAIPEKAIDRDTDTFWATHWWQPDPQHFYIDLLGSTDISGITIYRYFELNENGDSRDDYEIDVMTSGIPTNPSSWNDPDSGVQTVYSSIQTIHGYNIAQSLAVDPINLPLTGINGIRLTFRNRHWPTYFDIREIQVHSTTEYEPLVRGTVKDSSGNPIEGALIHIGPAVRDSMLAKQVLTDATGSYSIIGWKTGSDVLTADALGYGNVDTTIDVSNNGNPTTKDFVLTLKDEISLVPNWNFEEADPANPSMPRYWEAVEDGEPVSWISMWSRSTDYNHTASGQASGLLDQSGWTGEGKWSGWISGLTPVKSDGSVAYNVWLWRIGIDLDDENNDHYIEWYAWDGTTKVGTADWYGWYSPPVSQGSWWRNTAEWLSYRLSPPAGAAYMRVGFGSYCWDGCLGSYDDVIVEEVPLVKPESNKIADVKALEDDTYVSLVCKPISVITDGGGIPADTGYIEESDRSCAIRIDTSKLDGNWVGAGDTVNVKGTVATTGVGEKYISLTQMDWVSDTRPLDALCMNLRFANTELARGLYVKLTGKVVDVGTDNFTIADGSVDETGSPMTTVIYCGGLAKPAMNSAVRVRGVLSTDGTKAILYLRNDQVEIVDAASATQPLPFAGPVKAMRDYLFIGKFGNPEDDMTTQLATDFISVACSGAITETTVRPSLNETIGSNVWFRHDGLDELVDLNRLFGHSEHCTVYAHLYVWSPIAQNIDIPICTDDGGKVWINGAQVYEFNGSRSIWYGIDCIQDVPLIAGFNSVLIKIVQNDGDFGLVTQFSLPDTWTGAGWGNSIPIPGLGYLLNKQL